MHWRGRRWRRSKGGWRGWSICSGLSRSMFSSRYMYSLSKNFCDRADGAFFQLLQIARKHFDAGGERMRFTFPALITSAIKLCRRYKNREHLVRALIYLFFVYSTCSPFIGNRLANQSIQYPQIRAPTYLHPLYPNRSANNRATSLSTLSTDRR